MKGRNIFFIIIIIIVIILIIYDCLKSPVERYILTKKYTKMALKRTKEKNKKLMIIGDPCRGNGGLFKLMQKISPNTIHGDITLDKYGCIKCVKEDINNINTWRKYKDNEFVILETATISFSNNIKGVLKEIMRISGGDFYSGGGTRSFYWRHIGHKIYSSKYPNKLNYMIYPYNCEKDSNYKYYDLRIKKKFKIKL